MDGFININKPKNFTSHDVLNVLKRSFRGTKIGHAGTLDPAATGVLPVCIGKATKLQDYIMGAKKTYEAVIVFGCDSPTLDRDGDVTVTDPTFSLNVEALNLAVKGLTGEIQQIPPMVSAIKKDGIPLYKLAHKGQSIELAPRRVTIDHFEICEIREKAPCPSIRAKITCSKGTYIRSLARDLGQALGTHAIVERLCRLKTGAFALEDSYTLEDVDAMVHAGDYSFLLPMEMAVEHLPQIGFSDMEDIQNILAGNAIKIENRLNTGDTYSLRDQDGSLLALAKREEHGLKPFKILYSPRSRHKEMTIWHGLASVENPPGKSAVALGKFDGVHCGHRYLIEHMALEAEKRGLYSVVTFFHPHPIEFFRPQSHKYLQTDKDKLQRISSLGPDASLILTFDEILAEMSPREFAEDVLLRCLHTKSLWVGYNFHFGKNALGDVKWLREFGERHGMDVHVVDKITYHGEAVSSSTIKEYLSHGALEKANHLLGYAYHCSGEVIYGNQIGRTIGFPTANVDVSSSLFLPSPGIYITWISYDGKRHPSVTNIGHRPTIGDNLELTVEVHILDDSTDLYGKIVEVAFLTRLRGEKKFDGLDALKAQIALDKEKAEEYFARRGHRR